MMTVEDGSRRIWITGVALPGDRYSGGILVEEGESLVLWLHEPRGVERGDLLRFPDGRAARVSGVEKPGEADPPGPRLELAPLHRPFGGS